MDKRLSLKKLYDNLKDNLEFDSDVIAINKVLCALFKIDKETAIKSWKYIFQKYNLNTLKEDIDFTPIIKDFPAILFQELTLTDFLNILAKIPSKKEILLNIFNTFDNNSALNLKLTKLIIAKNETEEKQFILEIVKYKDKLPKLVFDLNTFLQTAILKHLEIPNFNLKLLQEYTQLPDNNKDKTLLKILLIDYL